MIKIKKMKFFFILKKKFSNDSHIKHHFDATWQYDKLGIYQEIRLPNNDMCLISIYF